MSKQRGIKILFFITIALCIALCGILLACTPVSSENWYTVSFDTQGGSAIAQIRLKEDSTLELPEPPKKDGFVFYGWYYDAQCTRKFNPFVFRLSSDITLYAAWVDANIFRHPIAVDPAIKHGAVTIANQVTEAVKGDIVELTVVPDEGYRLKEGSLCVNATPISDTKFTMIPESVTITAEFELCPYHVRIYAQNGWIVTDKESYTMGETVHFTAVPQLGYYLSATALNTTDIGIETNQFIMPPHDVLLSCEFQAIDYLNKFPIQIEESIGGSIRLDSESASAGEWVSVKFIAEEGFYFACVSVNDEYVEGTAFRMPNGDAVIKGIFLPIHPDDLCDIRVSQVEEGTVICPPSAPIGSTVTVDISDSVAGYTFVGLSVNGNYVHGKRFVVPFVNSELEVKPIFIPNPFQVISTEIAGGRLEFSQEFALPGTMVFISVFPNEGYYLAENHLTVNGEIIRDLRFIMPEKDAEIDALFLKKEGAGTVNYPIRIIESVGGRIVASKNEGSYGEEITITVLPEDGYRYVGGSLNFNGNEIGPDGIFYMPEGEAWVYAEFEKFHHITSMESAYGNVFAIKETAAVGEWVPLCVYGKGIGDAIHATVRVNGSAITDNDGFYMPNEDVILTLEIGESDTKQIFNITVENSNGGSIKTVPSAYVGQWVNLDVQPNDGYRFVKMERLGAGGQWEEQNLSFYMPGQNITVRAVFSAVSEVTDSFIVSAYRMYYELKNSFGNEAAELRYTADMIYEISVAAGCADAPLEINGIFTATKPFPWAVISFKDVRNSQFYAELFKKYYISLWKMGSGEWFEDGTLVLCKYDEPKELYDAFRFGVFRDDNGFYYSRSDGSIGIWSYFSDTEFIEIPMLANGLPVRRIAPFALRQNKRLKYLHLGAVTQLSDYAIAELPALKSVFLSGLQILPGTAFWNNPNLEEWILPSDHAYLSLSDGVIYSKDYQTAIRSVNRIRTQNLVLDSRCRTIGKAAFATSDLSSVDFNRVNTIGDYAFYGCGNLTDLKERNISLITAIGDYAFYDTAVTEWKWGKPLSIGEQALPLGNTMNARVAVIGDLFQEVTGKSIWQYTDSEFPSDRLVITFSSIDVLNRFGKAVDTAKFDPCFQLLSTAIIGSRSAIIFHTEGGEYLDGVISYRGSSYPLPTPTKSGYRFVGWYLDRDYHSAAPDILPLTSAQYHLWAKWSEL